MSLLQRDCDDMLGSHDDHYGSVECDDTDEVKVAEASTGPQGCQAWALKICRFGSLVAPCW